MSPSIARLKTPILDPKPHGEYKFQMPSAAAARIDVFCSPLQAVRQATMYRAVEILGQALCDWQSEGTFSWATARQVLRGKGWSFDRIRRVITWLCAAEVLVESFHGVRITEYARHNRSRTGWANAQAARRAADAAKKRATRLAAAQKHSADRVLEALETPLLVANSGFVPVSREEIYTPPPPCQLESLTGGLGMVKNLDPPPPTPKPARQVSVQAEQMSQIDTAGVLKGLFAKAEPASEAQSAKLRAVFEAAPEPAQPVAPPPEPEPERPVVVNDVYALFAGFGQKLSQEGRHRTPEQIAERLTNRSRPTEVRAFERVPITAEQLDALVEVPDAMRQELLAGGYTLAEVTRVYDAARQDKLCRMPNRVLLSRLKAGQGKRP